MLLYITSTSLFHSTLILSTWSESRWSQSLPGALWSIWLLLSTSIKEYDRKCTLLVAKFHCNLGYVFTEQSEQQHSVHGKIPKYCIQGSATALPCLPFFFFFYGNGISSQAKYNWKKRKIPVVAPSERTKVWKMVKKKSDLPLHSNVLCGMRG